MEEWVDIWTEAGVPTGKRILKSEAHRKGIFHPTVHLWIYNSHNQVLLQKRALVKNTFPGKWDVAVAGHITAGDSPLETVIREAREELGISLDETSIEFLGILPSKVNHSDDLIDNEFHHIYCVRADLDTDLFSLQEEEVSEVAWFEWKQLFDQDYFSGKKKDMVPFDKPYLSTVINHLSSKFH